MMDYKTLGEEVGQLVDEKNTAYGNSFNVAEDFIKLLWPNGVPPDAFNDMLCVVRIFDKLKRIATNKAYGGESPYRDIAGYALLGLMKDKVRDGSAYASVGLTDAIAVEYKAPTTWTPAELVEETPVLELGYDGFKVKKTKCIGCKLPDVYAHCPVHSPYPPVNYPLPKPKKIRKKKNKA